MSQTAEIAADIYGDALYQERARRALPLLVRQAEAGELIFYGDLAAELGMPNARNLNYPLGAIGRTLEALSKRWKQAIPPLQCLVVNRQTGLPGEGIGWFLIRKEDYGRLPLSRRRDIVRAELGKITAYPHWREVLDALSLPMPVSAAPIELLERAGGKGGGESEAHLWLKRHVLSHPEVLGLRPEQTGAMEYRLPSGDCLDVSFPTPRLWVGVEVKSRLSDDADLLRGLFQCVKYKAVMEAMQAVQGETRSVRAVLVLEGTLPFGLLGARNVLGVEVVEGVAPPKEKAVASSQRTPLASRFEIA